MEMEIIIGPKSTEDGFATLYMTEARSPANRRRPKRSSDRTERCIGKDQAVTIKTRTLTFQELGQKEKSGRTVVMADCQ